MQLVDLIKQNKNLCYKDADTSKSFIMKDLDVSFFSKKEDKKLVFLYLDNSCDSVATLWTCFDSPHAIALLNPKLNESFKNELENTYQPHYVFDPTRIEIMRFVNKSFIFNLQLFEREVSTKNIIHPFLKVLLTTSGTTGSPKFVKLSEQNIIANAQSIAAYLPIEPNDVVPLNLSIFYSYGLSVLTSNSLKSETVICTNKDIMNKDFWTDLEQLGYTTMAGVPYVYEMLNRIGFLKKNYPSLRYMTQAGGKLSPKLVEEFGSHLHAQSKQFYVMYGQTEATARMSYLPPKALNNKKNSIGIAIPNGSFSIDTETSELIYKGPNVFGGYANNQEDLAIFEPIESLRTGDMAEKDEDGFYYITGRLKRFAKIFGTRTNLDEVETHLKNEFTDTMFYVIGKNDEKLIVFAHQSEIEDNQIKHFLKEKMLIHPSVIQIQRLSTVPLTSNGKVDYKILSNG
jgi:acyl-CoA synthetase (AMP-forming)/AMP-acid ligase II